MATIQSTKPTTKNGWESRRFSRSESTTGSSLTKAFIFALALFGAGCSQKPIAGSPCREPSSNGTAKHCNGGLAAAIPGRPNHIIPNSGKASEGNEVSSGGHIATEPGEVKDFVRSGEFRDGVYVIIVVRQSDGKDILVYDNRIPERDIALEGKINTHRTLAQKYRDVYHSEPQVVAAGECLVTMGGDLVACSNQAGTYIEGNISAEYLASAAGFYGFRKSRFTQILKVEDGSDPDLGHVKAAVQITRERGLLRNDYQLLTSVREYVKKIYLEHSGDNPSYIDEKWMRRAIELRRQTDPNKKRAYELILMVLQRVRDGTSGAVYEVLDEVFRNKTNPEAIHLIERYLPDFYKEASNSHS